MSQIVNYFGFLHESIYALVSSCFVLEILIVNFALLSVSKKLYVNSTNFCVRNMC